MSQFKYATDEDLRTLGMSRPEIRRLRKYHEKHFPHGYLSKIKRLLHAAPSVISKRDDGNHHNHHTEGVGGTNSGSLLAVNGSSFSAPDGCHTLDNRINNHPSMDNMSMNRCSNGFSSPGKATMATSGSVTSNNKHIIPPDAISVNKQLGTGEFGIVQQGVWTNGAERVRMNSFIIFIII